MKVLLDMNVVLDVLLVRQPWFVEASQVWDAHLKGQITGAIAAFTVPTVFYVVHRQTDLNHANDAVRICLSTLEIVPVLRTTLERARTLSGSDYEDNLQLACALETQMDCLVTRDPSGYPGASIPILTPSQLLAQLAQGTP
jgi:predicted nucleic acid-binding protein